MGDLAIPNWPVDCPRLHKFVVELNGQLLSDEQSFERKLGEAADALAAARTYMLTWRANQPEFTELATCRTNFFEGKIAKTPALRDVDNPVEDHVWSSHERMITLQGESVIHSSHLNEFYCALRPDDRDGMSQTDFVGFIKIYGWLPEYLCNLNQERLFHLPWPIGTTPTRDRKHSDHERFLALVVVHEASCSFASLIPKDFVPNEGANWGNWLFLHVGDVKIRASDAWISDLYALAGTMTVSADEEQSKSDSHFTEVKKKIKPEPKTVAKIRMIEQGMSNADIAEKAETSVGNVKKIRTLHKKGGYTL